MKKKLYFDFQFTRSSRLLMFPCTFQTSPVLPIGNNDGIVTERHGQILEPLAALTQGMDHATKERREVSIWFNLATPITSPMDGFGLYIYGGKTGYTPGFGNAPWDGKKLNALYTEHFRVALTLYQKDPGLNPFTMTGATPLIPILAAVATARNKINYRGTLFVQRQHSIEV